MAKVRAIELGEIRKANADLSQRIQSEDVTIAYNPEADVLSIAIGAPRPALTEPRDGDLLYRVDPDTLKIVGVEIVAFEGHFLKKRGKYGKALQAYAGQKTNGTGGPTPLGQREREQIEELMAL